jgi:DNA-binding MarR family transcriptional regulator
MPTTYETIEKIRSFNRFYTNVLGLLDQHFLETPFSLIEGRVLYEINQMEPCYAKKIRENISIDEGYLSRIIDKFVRNGLIVRRTSPDDRRLQILSTTKKGQDAFAKLNENQNRLIAQLTEKLSEQERAELVRIMQRMETLLTTDPRA